MMTKTPILKAAIDLIKSGYREEARALLREVLEDDPLNEVAFFWYVDTLNDIRDRVLALEDFLGKNPGSEKAQTVLTALKKQVVVSGNSNVPSTPPGSPSQASSLSAALEEPEDEEHVEISQEELLSAAAKIEEQLNIEPESEQAEPEITLEPVVPVENEIKSAPEESKPPEGEASIPDQEVKPLFDADAVIAKMFEGIDDESMNKEVEITPPFRPPRPASEDVKTQPRKVITVPMPPPAGKKTRQVSATKTVSKPVSRKVVIRILGTLILLMGCCVTIGILLNNNYPFWLSNEQLYARKMKPVVQSVEEWTNGPIAEWNTAMGEIVNEGQTTTYQDMLFYNMSMGYTDVVVERKLSPSVTSIELKGTTVLESLSVISPPPAISDAHYQVIQCIQYEVQWAKVILDFLQNNTPPELGENLCGQFPTAFNQMKGFVEAYSDTNPFW